MSSDSTRSEELIFTLQGQVRQLEERVKELGYINQEHKHLNGLLKEELKIVTNKFRELQAKLNIKVMNGQWLMSNEIDADDLELKEKTDE